MILADKIITLRKKNGWSQEELAEQLNVSRQAVSKWEGAQSVPDLNRILQMSEIFGVSTDYLLKEEQEEADYMDTTGAVIGEGVLRRVSLQEANEFLEVKEQTTVRIAFATFLCVISPIMLILLTTAAELGYVILSEDVAGGIGMITLLLFIIVAVPIYISCGSKTAPFEFLEKEPFETEYGVEGMVKERRKQFRDTYVRYNILGTCLCICAAIPLFAGAFFAKNEMVQVITVGVLIAMVGIGTTFFIRAGIPWASMDKLLQEGEYTKARKQNKGKLDAIGVIYWLVIVAIFLAYSFVTNDWRSSWIIWPVAGVLYGAVLAACEVLKKQ